MADTTSSKGELDQTAQQSQRDQKALRMEMQELLLEYERLSDSDIATATKEQIKGLRKGKIPANVDERIFAVLSTRATKSSGMPALAFFCGLATLAFGLLFAVISAFNGENAAPGLGIMALGVAMTAIGYFPVSKLDREFNEALERFSNVEPELPASGAGPAPPSGSPFDVPPQE